MEKTEKLGLNLPERGYKDWDIPINENFRILDTVGGGGGLEIGDIGIALLGIDEAENKRRYLNGQVILQSQFEAFTKMIKERAALYSSLVVSETNWQAEITNSKLGQCGKFVIDDTAGTIRLPKVVNIQGLQDLSLLGGIKAESLPNIVGDFSNCGIKPLTDGYESNGAFKQVVGDLGTTNAILNPTKSARIEFDASLSNEAYQDNAPVQQEAIQYPYFIQVATGVEESVDITREIELNNPFSLLDYKWSEYEITNASWLLSNGAFQSGATYISVYNLLLEIYNGTITKDGVSVKLSTEAYTDTDFVINTADTTFRLPIKVKLASGNAVVGNGKTLVYTDGTKEYGAGYYFDGTSQLYTLADGTPGTNAGTLQSGNPPQGANTVGITTNPENSGLVLADNDMYLYFYVGETIQDANVIAASQVLTTVADSVRKSSAADRATVVGWGMPDYTAGIQEMSSNIGQREFTAEFDCLFQVRFLSAGYCHWRVNDGNAPDQLCGSTGTNYTQVPIYISKGTKMTGLGSGGTWNVYVYPLRGEV